MRSFFLVPSPISDFLRRTLEVMINLSIDRYIPSCFLLHVLPLAGSVDKVPVLSNETVY